MQPAVSIVIPLYNKEKWIERTLSSLNNQTFSDWEAIIVDDGSTDQSVQVVENFILKNPGNWIIIKKRNEGQCKARNAGITEARGEFIAFLDADDIWSKNKLADQVSILRENSDISLVISPYLIFSESNKKASYRLVLHGDSRKMLTRWLKMKGYGAGTESTGMTRSTLLKNIGSFDESLSTSAGLNLTIELAKRGRIVFSNRTLMAYRIHTGQWHSDLQVLSRDMEALRNSSPKIMGAPRKSLEAWHSAYLKIAQTRKNGRLFDILLDGGTPSKSFFLRIVLILNILARNALSRIRGKFARQICRFTPEDFEEFTKSF